MPTLPIVVSNHAVDRFRKRVGDRLPPNVDAKTHLTALCKLAYEHGQTRHDGKGHIEVSHNGTTFVLTINPEHRAMVIVTIKLKHFGTKGGMGRRHKNVHVSRKDREE